jgi:hypothetical protein
MRSGRLRAGDVCPVGNSNCEVSPPIVVPSGDCAFGSFATAVSTAATVFSAVASAQRGVDAEVAAVRRRRQSPVIEDVDKTRSRALIVAPQISVPRREASLGRLVLHLSR